MGKSVDDYLTLPYTIEIVYDDSGEEAGWFAKVAELPGCMTQADSFEALEWLIKDAMRAWIEVSLADDLPVPEPRPIGTHDNFAVYVANSLYPRLLNGSQAEGVNVETFVNRALDQAVANSPG